MCVPLNYTAEDHAQAVRTGLGPFLQQEFPQHAHLRVIIDGEQLLHTEGPQQEYRRLGIHRWTQWPKGSPDMNPQENVWAWAEKKLRELEEPSDTITTFKRKCSQACKAYPRESGVKLFESMARRMQRVLEKRGLPPSNSTRRQQTV